MNIYRNIKNNIKYHLKHVASASDSLLVTLQCTKMRLSTSNLPVTLKTPSNGNIKEHLNQKQWQGARSKTEMLTFYPVASNPVKTG